MSRSGSGLVADPVVLRLLEILSGDRPLAEAGQCLDPAVVIHVDDGETWRGIPVWKRWVHLMRERGRLADLRFEPLAVDVTVDVVWVTFRWAGRLRRGREAGRPRTTNTVGYRLRDGIITEIWTRKANYVDVFGPWVRATALYRLYLAWALVYFGVHRDPELRLRP
jgi:ketosteroid isomerase-like protein